MNRRRAPDSSKMERHPTGLLFTSEGRRVVRLVKNGELYVREGFSPDVSVLKEYPNTYRKMIDNVAGLRFLDIGAHIGSFTVMAMLHGAIGGDCYEPERGAVSVLKHNVRSFGHRIKIISSAISRCGGDVILSVPPSGNSISATTQAIIKGRQDLVVSSVSFNEAVEASGAALIKTDCEGAELEFLDGRKLPHSVKVVCGELHRGHGSEDRCLAIINSFRRWHPIHEPISYSYKRCWIVAWRR